jgi:hypothetical protein
MVTLENKDSNRIYCWVPEHGHYDRGYYESLGYELETLREGGVRPMRLGATKMGGPIRQLNGMLLMSCPREMREDLDRAGQDDMDALEKRIYDKSFPKSQVHGAGISTRGASGDEVLMFENETTPSVVTPVL